MKIQTIHYERLLGLPGFNNIKVGITAQVEEMENPDEAFNAVRAYVHAKLKLLTGTDPDPKKLKGDDYGG